jgi:uncharacterized membrane protein YgcG
MPDKNDLFAQYQILEDLGDFPSYSLFKVKAPNGSIKLWKKVDLQFNSASIETRLLPVIEKVQHANLNAVSNSFLFQDKGLLFVESEFPVKTLRHRLDELKGTGTNGIPISELFGYIAQVADAIDFLNAPMHHYQGKKIAIYHRALSPDSLHLFEEKSKIICKLGDFGLAKPIVESAEAARHSLGLTNYDYAPPEFDEGLTTNTSDQYSLATTYVELRTGRLPFTGTLLQKLQAQLNGTPDLSLLEPNERPVVARALSREPHSRFPTCKDFVKNLQMALGGVVAMPIFSPTTNRSGGGAASAEPAAAGGGGGALFGGGGGGSGWALSSKPVGKSGGSLFNVKGGKGAVNTPNKPEGFSIVPPAPAAPVPVPAPPKAAAKVKDEPKPVPLPPVPVPKMDPKSEPTKPEKKAKKEAAPARVPTPIASEGWKLETAALPDKTSSSSDSVSDNWTPGKVTAGKSNPSMNLPTPPPPPKSVPLADLPVPTPPPPTPPPASVKESISVKARETLELIKKKQNAVAPSTPVPITMDKQMPGTKLINSGSHPAIKLPPKPGSRPVGALGETPAPPRPANVPVARRASTDQMGKPLPPQRGVGGAAPVPPQPRRNSPAAQGTRRNSGGAAEGATSLRGATSEGGAGGGTSWITIFMVMFGAFCLGVLAIALFTRK